MADWKSFSASLMDEMNQRIPAFLKERELATIYFGGGTPSLIPDELFRQITNRIYASIQSSGGKFEGEFTLEVNPEDVTPDKVKLWADAGINRVSMGVQSLDDKELKSIGRLHTAATSIRAFEMLRERFNNISLDIMFGLPGQNLTSLKQTLESICKLEPEHISAYSLTYEERTPLKILRDNGTIDEADEDISVDMYELIYQTLIHHGYSQYEISNYSLPGFRSHHNSSYWQGFPYLGLGPSAHSYDGNNIRTYNIEDIRQYMKEGWESKFSIQEILSDDELREEMIMTHLRTAEGLDLSLFSDRFGLGALTQLMKDATPHIRRGTLKLNDKQLQLSEKGMMISDDIIAALF